MLIQQISVFVENKAGRLADITDVLAKAGIDIRAMSIADTTNFGILRLIVNRPGDCETALKEAGLTVSLTSVIAIGIDDTPGSLSHVLKLLGDENIDVHYVYAFISNSPQACVVLRVDDNERAIHILEQGGIRLFTTEEVYNL